MNVEKIDGRKNKPTKERYLYNEPLKLKFLDFVRDNKSFATYDLYYKELSKLSHYERDEWKNDVFNVSDDDITDFINACETPSFQSRDIFRSIIRLYVRWVHGQNTERPQFDLTELVKFPNPKVNLNINGVKIQYIKDERELHDICFDFCANAQDAVCFVLPYYSLSGNSHEEILNLTKHDIKKNGVIARKNDGRERFVEIPEPFLSVLSDANEETTYFKNNNMCKSYEQGMRSCYSFEMQPSEYVLKVANYMKDYHSNGVTPQIISQRVKKIAKLYDKRNLFRLNPQTIKMSGLFNLFRKMEKVKGGSLERKDYVEALEKYDVSKGLLSSYKAKYKLFKELV